MPVVKSGIGVEIDLPLSVRSSCSLRYAFVAYVGLLMAAYIGDRFSGPPSDIADVAWSGIIAMVILIPFAWWFDRHRALRTATDV